MRKKSVMLALTSVSFVVGCNVASASQLDAPEAEARIKHVKINDLDLSRAEGRKILHRRIGWAAMDVCPLNFGPSLGEMMRASSCRRKALHDTQQQVAALESKADGQAELAVLAQARTR